MFVIWICSTFSLISARYTRLSIVNSSELSPIGTSIIQLIDFLPNSNWDFQFLSSSSMKSYFLLDSLKGTISIKRYLDREELCQLKFCSCFEQCLLELQLNAISNTSTQIFSLPILIIDENDNSCYFPQEAFVINLMENLPMNTRISLPLAYDLDLPPNNIQSYALPEMNSSSQFYLENSSIPSLIILEKFDREYRDNYSIKFCAYEGNQQRHSCCTYLIFNIIDVNDNSPRFSRLPSIVELSESTPIGTEIIQINATDFDQGLNGQIRYSFSRLTSYDQYFHLDSINGSIRLLQNLDYEKQTNYQLQIQAIDLGENPIPTYTTLIIQIIDENDCLPELFIFPSLDVQLINNSLIYFLENLSLHTPLIYLTVSDRDTNENGRVSMELISWNSLLDLQKINNQSYVLRTNGFFDREEKDSFSFTLIIYDHGQPRQSIINQFHVHLLDINDCFPIFNERENSTLIIDENNEKNLVLRTIDVHDFDLNDRVTLQLEFPNIEDENLFEINENNQLILRQSLDYEHRSIYSLIIIAEDLIGHRTSLFIHLYLNDLNDNPVRFQRKFTRISISKDLPIGTIFAAIQATDLDRHAKINYTIQSNLIGLNSNGSMFIKQRFDRIQLKIIANDSLHTDWILIEIHVENQSILKSQSPLCLINHHHPLTLELNSLNNFSFSLRNPSSLDFILLPNGTLILPENFLRYSFDVYLQDIDVFLIFENFVILNSDQCSSQFNRQIFCLCLIVILLIAIIYLQQPRKLFSSTSTYLKISRSFDDDKIFSRSLSK